MEVNMKNRILLVFLALVLVVSLAAFAACKVEEEPPPVEEVWQWPDKLMLSAISVEDPIYGLGIGWTTPLAEETGMKIRVVCQPDHATRMRWMKEGIIFLGAMTLTGKDNLEATGIYATRDGGPWNTRGFYPSRKMDMGFVVLGDSGIKTPYDIKPGMKIIYFSYIPHGKPAMEALLAWGQVDPEDVVWVPAGSIGANLRLLMEGKGDVAYGFTTLWGGWYEAEAGPHGLGWIAMDAKTDPEGAKRYLAIRPETAFGVMTTGVPSARNVPAMSRISVYITSAATDPELVYHLVKWLDENYDKFKDAHPQAEFMTIDYLMTPAETSFQPLHEGTVRYLEELGRWTPAHEARRQQNIDLIDRWVEAYQAALDMADERGIEVSPENEEWVELWDSYKEDLPVFRWFVGLD
jgi:TRAP transporter TAXI family solute receptor